MAPLPWPRKETKFIYIPSSGDAGLTDEFHGAAVLNGTAPFHAAIDEVKYTGSGNDVGEVMSYIATYATAQRAWYRLNPSGTGPSLSLPLVQKGSQATGKGDTSGIDLFDASASRPVTTEIMFYWPNGTPSTVSIPGPLQLMLGALNTATIYTMNASDGVIGLGNMETNFQGSAQIKPVDGRGVLVGVSNNVNYGVSGDGSAVYNLYNSWGQFRSPCSQLGGCWGNEAS